MDDANDTTNKPQIKDPKCHIMANKGAWCWSIKAYNGRVYGLVEQSITKHKEQIVAV